MSGTFWYDVLVDFLGGLGAGVLILWVAEQFFGIRRESQRRKDEREAATKRASKYLSLLRDEVKGIEQWIPNQVTNLESKKWGTAVPVQSPVWDLVQQAGELVALVEPGLLKRTASFYERLEMARWVMDFIVQSWLAPEYQVLVLDRKRGEAVSVVAKLLREVVGLAPGLVESLEQEIVALGGKLQGTGQG